MLTTTNLRLDLALATDPNPLFKIKADHCKAGNHFCNGTGLQYYDQSVQKNDKNAIKTKICVLKRKTGDKKPTSLTCWSFASRFNYLKDAVY